MPARIEQESESSGEESIYDERLAVRRLAFRNTEPNPNRITLPLDQSAESLSSLGVPAWLVGSVFILIPCVFDVYYWKSRVTVSGIVTRREMRTIEGLTDCPRMMVQVEFMESGQVVQVRSNLLSPGALEEWQRAQGDTGKLDAKRVAMVLGGRRRHAWWEAHPKEWDPESTVIQETIQTNFPMGPYRGSDNRLILHQAGSKLIQLLDPTSLRPRQNLKYTELNRDFIGVPCPAPVTDPRTRQVINVLCEYSKRGKGHWAKYHIVSLAPATEAFQDVPHVGNVIATFMAPPTKLVNFAITESHVVVPIHSLRYIDKQPDFNLGIVDGVNEYLQFDEQADTLFYIISRQYGQLVAVYRSEPAFISDIVNAFEADQGGGSAGGGTIFIDAIASDRPPERVPVSGLRVNQVDELTKERPSGMTLRRYCMFRLGEEIARFDGAAGQLPSFPLALFHHLTDYPLWATSAAPMSIGCPYRYAYGMSIDRDNRGRPGFLPNAILKCDLATPIRSMQWHRIGCYPSAPVFVPQSDLIYGSRAEDEGVLISIVLDVFAQRSYIVVLDARDLRELARYILPRTLPLGQAKPIWCPSKATSPVTPLPMTFEPTAPEKTALLPKEQ
jgi:hypothetical protein